MMQKPSVQKSWQEANKDYIVARLAPVREALKRVCAREAGEALFPPEAGLPTIEHEDPAALESLGAAFDLSLFEVNVLLLCAGVELDSEFAQLCTTAQGGSQLLFPTFNLALTLFSTAYWFALSPVAPLRFWRMIEIEKGHPLLLSPLRIDERILHYLVGLSYLDQRLANLLQALPAPASLVPSHLAIVREIIATWSAAEAASLPRIELYGSETLSKHNIAALIGSLTGQRVLLLQATALPTNIAELEEKLHLWEREVLLDGGILLLDCQNLDEGHTANDAVARVIDVCAGALIVSCREMRTWLQGRFLTFEVQKPTSDEQLSIWQSALRQQPTLSTSLMNKLVSHFSLNETAISAISANVQGRLAVSDQAQLSVTSERFGAVLWDTCRRQVQPELGHLAQRIVSTATWEDLVLPEAQSTILRSVAMHMRQREQVYKAWGFADKTARGLGISALFVGGSGTGKTMAAEVLANELGLDLYRIDLSSVVSKYIGETEKHLQRIFAAAEESSALLLFDEADALLGKRSEVKDSHDRYANIEVSYLLQRIEAYRGLVFLTTNMKDALDPAFLRRIRFIVHFPFPDAAQRSAIWQRIFPQSAPTANLDTVKLAQLNIAGGNIRNIALNAAFIAADAEEPIGMRHLLRAAQDEYIKLEKTMTSSEIQGWVV